MDIDALRMMGLRELLIHNKMRIRDLAGEVGTSERTIVRNLDKPRMIYVNYLILRAGYLEIFGMNWQGFRMVGSELVTPGGWGVSPGEVLALPYFHALAAEARRKGSPRAERWRFREAK